jgi:hypothetical protein
MSIARPSAVSADRFPVSVITVCEPVTDNPWISERWRVLGVVAGDADGARGPDAPQPSLIRGGAGARQYLWTGFEIRLFPAGADSYYFNLVGEQPIVLVVCQASEDRGLAPMLVTADYIDALAHREAGADVHAVPIPPEIYVWLEQYVLEHYRPDEDRPKRKHGDWTKAAG